MKSEKALEYLHGTTDEKEFLEIEDFLPLRDAIKAVEIAEAEMRDIALNAFLTVCQNTNIHNCGECNLYGCEKGKLFLQQFDKQDDDRPR